MKDQMHPQRQRSGQSPATQELLAQFGPPEPLRASAADEVVLVETGVSRRTNLIAGFAVLAALMVLALVAARFFFW